MAKNGNKDSVKILEGVGLKEVSRKTYIELDYLKLMVSKEFSKLQRIKTLGFVKIIQREYDVDMSDWVAEFEEYLRENSAPVTKKSDEILEEYRNRDIRKQSKIYIAALIVFLAFLAVFIYTFTKETNERTYDTSSANYNFNYENLNFILNNNTQGNDTESSNTVDNKTALSNAVPSTSNISDKQTSLQSISRASISPNVELWVGIVDLNTFRKRSYLQNTDISLDLNKEQIIITGHDDFTLKIQNEDDKVFTSRGRVHLRIKDGKVEEIKASEFMQLNRGESW